MIGVHWLLYQGPPKTSAPHYDITERARALRLGAIDCDREQIVAVFRRVRVRDGVHAEAAVPARVLAGKETS